MSTVDPKRWRDDPSAELNAVRRLLRGPPPHKPLDSATATRVKHRFLHLTSATGASPGDLRSRASRSPETHNKPGLRYGIQRTVAGWLGVPTASLGPVSLALTGAALSGAVLAYAVASGSPRPTTESAAGAHLAAAAASAAPRVATPSAARSAHSSANRNANKASKSDAPERGGAAAPPDPTPAAPSGFAPPRPGHGSTAPRGALTRAGLTDPDRAAAPSDAPTAAPRIEQAPRASSSTIGAPPPRHQDEARAPAAAPPTRASAPGRGAARAGLRASSKALGSLSEETRLLEQARSQLARNPRGALALAAEHEQRFVRGQLIEQRRLIQLEARLRLGQDERAMQLSERLRTALSQARAKALLQRYGVLPASDE